MPEPPPHSLDLVIGFVNTLDMELGTEELGPEGAAAWFVDAGLLEPEAEMDESDRRQALSLREALRSLMLANNGGASSERAGQVLEEVARTGELSVRFAAGGVATLAPRAEGFAGALAMLLVPVAYASGDGTWQRVKACQAPDCLWAFYDRSRNRSGVWCKMAVCGNRTKVRTYRSRGERRRR
jgi:predicted RNA-binding Zn ribbon-like protein